MCTFGITLTRLHKVELFQIEMQVFRRSRDEKMKFINQWFSTQGDLPPPVNIRQCLEIFLIVSTGGLLATGT